ncbi:MAG: hypothetical protein M3401_02180 [Actinomycetota bacterium]|nr:hypothetical protein [Actinomycetota bacterium]
MTTARIPRPRGPEPLLEEIEEFLTGTVTQCAFSRDRTAAPRVGLQPEDEP